MDYLPAVTSGLYRVPFINPDTQQGYAAHLKVRGARIFAVERDHIVPALTLDTLKVWEIGHYLHNMDMHVGDAWAVPAKSLKETNGKPRFGGAYIDLEGPEDGASLLAPAIKPDGRFVIWAPKDIENFVRKIINQ